LHNSKNNFNKNGRLASGGLACYARSLRVARRLRSVMCAPRVHPRVEFPRLILPIEKSWQIAPTFLTNQKSKI
jgi:hypothetical protein